MQAEKEDDPANDTRISLWKPDGYSRIYDIVVPVEANSDNYEPISDQDGLSGLEQDQDEPARVTTRADIDAIRIGMSLKSADGAVRKSVYTACFLTFCFLVVTVLVTGKMTKIILTPFERLYSCVQSVVNGNLSEPISAPNTNADIGRLFSAVDQLKSRLESAIKQIRSISEIADCTVSDLVSYGNNQSGGAREQSSSLTQTSSTVEELATTSNRISENAKKVAELADQSFSGMEVIRTNAKEGAGKILALGEKSQNIGEVVAIIDDITTQTNLLALNASIEAARAGVAGKGFAVVAEEIRKLATNVAGSTEQIRKITNEIQDASSASVMATENVSKSVDQGIELSKTTAESAVHIHTATQQQKSATDQMVAAIREMVDITQRTNTDSKQITETADRLAQATQEQRKLLEQYKIG
jgi:methyl-accepting chemotaxis protein